MRASDTLPDAHIYHLSFLYALLQKSGCSHRLYLVHAMSCQDAARYPQRKQYLEGVVKVGVFIAAP